MYHRFTVQVVSLTCEVLTLTVKDLSTLKIEFPSIFQELFEDAKYHLMELLMVKLEVIRQAEFSMLNSNRSMTPDVPDNQRLAGSVGIHFLGGM